jgi:Cu-Zn family superoxide dismutase
MRRILALSVMSGLLGTGAALGDTATVTINKIDESGIGAPIGVVVLSDSKKGLSIKPKLSGLPPGQHGFHVHVNPDCGPGEQNGKKASGLAAGGHFDPEKTGKHRGPLSTEGHKGDMPFLTVNDKGESTGSLLAPNLKVNALKGHSIMIHAGGDNYSDDPAPLGGGGARIACGIFK